MIFIPELMSVVELRDAVRDRCRSRRLAMDLTQAELARRSGVSLGSLKRFERTGQISFESLIALAFVLGSMDEFLALFPPVEARSLDELTRDPPKRARGRKAPPQ